MAKRKQAQVHIKPEVLEKLRAVIADAQGRVPRGISWPATLDEVVNAYLAETGMERSTLVQLAVTQFLELPASNLPKALGRKIPPGNGAVEYVPIEELVPA